EVRGEHEFEVVTPTGRIACEWVVAAAGAWNREVAAMAGLELPIGTEVLQASITDSHVPVFPHVVTHVRGNLTLKQQRSGRILVGGAWRGTGDKATGERRLERESLVGNYRWAVDTIPAVRDARLLRAWTGFEGRTPDKLLLSGSVGRPRGLYMVGCGGGGFTFSPLTGRIAADFIVRGVVHAYAAPFDPSRFIAPSAARAAAAGH
ncbi:MAG TPA: FAD-binding oxidoreductase, partial [Vicinamibacteria bacterium]|nr:FAD-binding oxidoreductase [Vicinamibacteria bacterium]